MNTVETIVTETAATNVSSATVKTLRDFICTNDDFALLRETLRLYSEVTAEA